MNKRIFLKFLTIIFFLKFNLFYKNNLIKTYKIKGKYWIMSAKDFNENERI